MPVRIAIVGPGRVGTCFARRLRAASADVLGFVGRDVQRTRSAVAALGCGDALDWPALARAHCVIFAVGDGELREAVAAAADAGGRRCSLWLHTSGRHDLAALAPARSIGCRVGSLHPLAPFPGSVDVEPAAGAPVLVQGEARSLSLLLRLARMLELDPIVCSDQDRPLYHAACAIAANGATALFDVAQRALLAAGGLDSASASRVTAALMQAVVEGAHRHGAARALSGPVRRGDDGTVRAHLGALVRGASDAAGVYCELSRIALQLATDQGLGQEAAARLTQALDEFEARSERGGR